MPGGEAVFQMFPETQQKPRSLKLTTHKDNTTNYRSSSIEKPLTLDYSGSVAFS